MIFPRLISKGHLLAMAAFDFMPGIVSKGQRLSKSQWKSGGSGGARSLPAIHWISVETQLLQ